MTRVSATLLILTLGVALAATVSAHPLAPSLLELREQPEGQVHMLWKVSVLNPQAAALVPRLSPDCAGFTAGWPGATATEQVDTAWVRRFTFDCRDGGLAGRRVSVEGLESVESSVLVRVALAGGVTARAVLRGDAPAFTVTGTPTWVETARDYLILGFEHILGGFDHLLFVLGLLFLIRDRRMLLLTVTAFTAGHSVTLSLAATGLVYLPSGPVELAIAASIWVVALELARQHVARPAAGAPPATSCTGRRPWLVAGIFGLLHGFGFAGALAEAGLPPGDVPLALLSFNAGIELGQLAFIACVLALRWTLVRLLAIRVEPVWLGRSMGLAASYLIGILSTYWCLQRGHDLLLYL